MTSKALVIMDVKEGYCHTGPSDHGRSSYLNGLNRDGNDGGRQRPDTALNSCALLRI